jgi:hypothetical protein
MMRDRVCYQQIPVDESMELQRQLVERNSGNHQTDEKIIYGASDPTTFGHQSCRLLFLLPHKRHV